MNMGVSVSDDMFRAEVRAFLERNLPRDMADRNRAAVHPTREDVLAFAAILHRNGWSVPHWPREYGGPGWSALRRHIFEEEVVSAGAPGTNIQGVSLVGPVIYTFGNAAQKARYLPPIREGTEYWSQGFSEPGSGSDLASLRTRAVREGDVYVVNGQKIWTSQSMYADMIFCLVRTDPTVKPQLGISFLLVPARAPGVTIRPIESIDEGESLCEVFFDDVRVPAENLVGEEGKGWDYAKFLLGNERVATAEVPRNKRNLAVLKQLARAEPSGAGTVMDEPDFRARLARTEIDLLALESGALEALSHDSADPMLPSVLKLVGCELQQTIDGLQMETLGSHGAAFYAPTHVRAAGGPNGTIDGSNGLGPRAAAGHAADVTAEFLFRRAATIYGGSNEVQKNILSKLLLKATPAQPQLAEDLTMLRDSVGKFIDNAYPFEQRKQRLADNARTTRNNWQAYAEIGLLGAALPEDVGGLGGGADEIAVIAEALGRGLALEPFTGCAVLAGELIRQAGTPAQREALLPSLISGESIFAFAHDETAARGRLSHVATSARATDNGYVLNGAKLLVLGGGVADRFIVSARIGGDIDSSEGIALFLVDASAPGLARDSYRTIDGQLVADLTLTDVSVEAAARLGDETHAEAALTAIEAACDLAMLAGCAEAIGAMDRALWVTRDYLTIRKQFGATLSSFQALQHRLAEMFVELSMARAILRHALARVGAEPPERRRAVAAAKARIGRAGFFVGGQAIQLHGGIGMTEQYVVGHFFKRLLVLNMLFGDSNLHTQAYAAAL